VAGKQREHHDFRSSGEMYQQASGAVDRRTRFVPRVACGRRAGCGTGSVRAAGSNGGIGRLRDVLDNQNETREPGTLFTEREDKCLGGG
jgi:hypothetical protein